MSAPSPLITLTTDFGEGSSYVAAMKGAILRVCPAARILDLSHSIAPQNLIATAYFLVDALRYYRPRSIHVVVVDPGVGTARDLLCVQWNDQVVLAPDNGCWTILEPLAQSPVRVFRLTKDEFWQSPVSPTFHGRDILAPAAGHIGNGVSPIDLGVRTEKWVRLPLPEPVRSPGCIRGEVVVVDRFGNLISNISPGAGELVRGVHVGTQATPRFVRTYGDAEPGDLVALIGSGGRVEVAVVNGSAAARLGLGIGDSIEIAVG
jgi:S-adenosyl-L-methionine hydrolase (adenosine-forming)